MLMRGVSESFADDIGEIQYANVCTSMVCFLFQRFLDRWCNRLHDQAGRALFCRMGDPRLTAARKTNSIFLVMNVQIWRRASACWSVTVRNKAESQFMVGAASIGRSGRSMLRSMIRSLGWHCVVKQCRQSCVTSARLITNFQRWLDVEAPAVVWLPKTWGGFDIPRQLVWRQK